MSGLADMIIARIEGERDAAIKRAETAEKRVAELQALVDAAHQVHAKFGDEYEGRWLPWTEALAREFATKERAK